MNWFWTIYQKLSYEVGFARGLRGRPFARSWWADETTYAIGHIDARSKSLGPFVTGVSAPPRARPEFPRHWLSFSDFGRRLDGNFHA
jgi:hypothetical protein